MQSLKEIGPELILDEECLLYLDGVQKPADVEGRVKGDVADNIGTLVILAYLIAGGREEGEQDSAFGMLAVYSLNERASLLELSQ